MNLNPLATKRVTFAEFCALSGSDKKADLIEGEIYEEGPETLSASLRHGLIFNLLATVAEEKGLGRVVGFKVAFRFDDVNGLEPDIAFVRSNRLHLARRQYFDGRPDLAIEVVSDETTERDYVIKRRLYRRFGMLEYWIIDGDNQRVTLLRLDARGRYQEVRLRQGKYASKVVPGFFLRPEWLWRNPLPRMMDLRTLILADGRTAPQRA